MCVEPLSRVRSHPCKVYSGRVVNGEGEKGGGGSLGVYNAKCP